MADQQVQQIELDEDLEEQELIQSEEDESDETPPSDIVAFNELRSCSDLKRLHDAGQLEIQPNYQREDVWQPAQQTRFVDSLAKQLPIPSMCISLDYKTDKRQIVDGLQRISTIIKFLSDAKWRLSNLDEVDSRISNKTVEHVKSTYPEIYSRIENTVIPVTVLRCDLSKRNHQEYLFTIFHRLNTGGMKLNNQEIRNCIYSGPFNEMLKEVAWSEKSTAAFGLEKGKKYRFSTEELLLRALAFSNDYTKYKRPLPKYLNNYMSGFRNATDAQIDEKRQTLLKALSIIYDKALDSQPFPRLSKATVEAVFVGVIRNLAALDAAPAAAVRAKFNALRQHPNFSVEALKEGLSDPAKVSARLDTAIASFA